jgi:type II secretory pathway pseudopilin PulG
MRRLLDDILKRLHTDERGFTMVTVMGVMLAIMMLSAVAFAAAGGDLEGASYDRESKQAYAAAEAGVADYMFHLNQDNSFWAKCDSVPNPSAVSQRYSGTGTDPRKWRAVNGANTEYAIELLPANGAATCDTNNATGTMIDSSSGTFKIRSTGRVPTGGGQYAKRSIIATFKRRGFLDFLYFTDLETSDPAWYQLDTRGRQTAVQQSNGTYQGPDAITWASQKCSKYYRDGRGDETYYDRDTDGPDDGRIFWFDNNWYPASYDCSAIQFAPGDQIKGPFHTNDEMLVCGSPDFGRTAQDKVEVSAPDPGWRGSGGCSGNSPTFNGTFTPNAPVLPMPTSNSKLKKLTQANYKFTGTTQITLSGNNMIITNASMGLSNVSRPIPTNGIVYVEDGNCGVGYQPLSPYSAPAGCGDVYLKGSYSKDLTIAAEKDIVVTDDVTRNGDYTLGLIANNFVRVYKPASNLDLDGGSVTCSNSTTGPYGSYQQNLRIDAAILALQHSFTVDNYFCGAPLGTLTVNGVIAQKYRGPVGRGSGNSVANGYTKDYNYDDRLSLRQPPNFLDPVQSAWRIQRQTEFTPAR